MIEWKEGAVCYANGKQWFLSNGKKLFLSNYESIELKNITSSDAVTPHDNDFQLNEPKEGHYIPKSELDTEEKYNQAVEVFGLFGFDSANTYMQHLAHGTNYFVIENRELDGVRSKEGYCKTKLIFNQLMAAGELKRKMNERELSTANKAHSVEFNHSELPKSPKNPKAKEAYAILESMDIEWDNVKLKWYRKEWL